MRYIFGTIFKPLGIPSLEERGLTTPNFRPWNWKKENRGESELNEEDLGGKEGGIYSKNLVTEKIFICAYITK